MVEKKIITKKTTTAKKIVKKESQLTLDVYDLTGKVIGKQELLPAIFGEKVNKTLVAQAVRVYLANQRQGTRTTKSRGEVRGSTRKIYRQKGTGRARHGGIRAPIFVGGGVAWGPKQRDFSLAMPQKMKQKALASALSAKVKSEEMLIIAGMEKLEGKTKNMADMLINFKLRNINNKNDKQLLLVINDGLDNVVRSARNIEDLAITSANRLNIYDILTAKHVLFMQEAVEVLEKRFEKKIK